MLPPITDFCKDAAEGWNRLPAELLLCRPGLEHCSIGFLRTDGLQIMVSVKDSHTLHLSIMPVRYYMPGLSDEGVASYLLEKAPEVFNTFFEDRKWRRMPGDSRFPLVKHYYSDLP